MNPPRFAYFTLVLALLPLTATAQVYPVVSDAPLWGLPWVQGSSSNPFTDISFTGQALGPDSCTAYSFTSAPTTGYGYNGTLLCLSVAGSNIFTVSASNVVSTVPFTGPASATVPIYAVTGDTDTGFGASAADTAAIFAGGVTPVVTATAMAVTSFPPIVFNGGSTLDGITTANVIDQRNGTTGQTYNWFRTYTDATNFEALRAQFTSTIAYLTTNQAGTGTARALYLGTEGDATTGLYVGGAWRWRVGASAETYALLPSGAFNIGDGGGNSPVTIYAETAFQAPSGVGGYLSGGNPVGYNLSTYGVGTAYILTDTAAAVDFGTTDPVIVLDKAGTYLIFGQVNLAYNAATVATETASIKVRRTNNTAADLSVVPVLDLPTSTLLTHTYELVPIPPFVYTTAATDDSLTLFANVSAALSAGSIDATAIGTSIVAVRLY